MRTYALGLSAALAIVAGIASAQTATPVTVQFDLQVNQPSLFDDDRRDQFSGSVDDATGTTTFNVECSAGASAWLGLSRVDEACSVTGNGVIKNPNNPTQTLPRLSYSGGFTIEADSDGYTDASTILANYLRAGTAGAQNGTFGGSVTMQPENPSASALALGSRLIDNLKEKAAGTEAVAYDTQIDSIRFDGFTVPHVGQATSASCAWTGDAIYAYANGAWQMAFDVTCGDATYRLEGNMPLVDAVTGSAHDQEYRLNLVVPGTDGAAGGDPFAAADPFAVVDGITATLAMTNSGRDADGVYEKVTVEGDMIGTGVSPEVVRSFAQIMAIFARTFYGA